MKKGSFIVPVLCKIEIKQAVFYEIFCYLIYRYTRPVLKCLGHNNLYVILILYFDKRKYKILIFHATFTPVSTILVLMINS